MLVDKAIKEHALHCYPEEMCGVIQNGVFIPVTNVHESPVDNFTLDNIELAIILQKVK